MGNLVIYAEEILNVKNVGMKILRRTLGQEGIRMKIERSFITRKFLGYTFHLILKYIRIVFNIKAGKPSNQNERYWRRNVLNITNKPLGKMSTTKPIYRQEKIVRIDIISLFGKIEGTVYFQIAA